MFSPESKNPAIKLFIFFAILMFGLTFYKSFKAVFSTNQLNDILYLKLNNKVDLNYLKIGEVKFKFFHRYLFRPGVYWNDIDISYIKNCNYIEFKSPQIHTQLGLLSVLKGDLNLKHIRSEDLEFVIIRNKACEEPKGNITSKSNKRINNRVHNSNSDLQATAFDYSTDDRELESRGLVLSDFARIPKLSIKNLKLRTEKNIERYYTLTNLRLNRRGPRYILQSDVNFSRATNLSQISNLKISGSFDENQNIELSARLRESRMQVQIETLKGKNFKTTLRVNNLPLHYFGDIEVTDSKTLKFHSSWVNFQAYSLSHWDDFFEKNIYINFDELNVNGESIRLKAKPFVLHLATWMPESNLNLNIERIHLEGYRDFLSSLIPLNYISRLGSISGELNYSKGEGIQSKISWHQPQFNFPLLGYDFAVDPKLLNVKVHNDKNYLHFDLSADEIQNLSFEGESVLSINRNQIKARINWENVLSEKTNETISVDKLELDHTNNFNDGSKSLNLKTKKIETKNIQASSFDLRKSKSIDRKITELNIKNLALKPAFSDLALEIYGDKWVSDFINEVSINIQQKASADTSKEIFIRHNSPRLRANLKALNENLKFEIVDSNIEPISKTLDLSSLKIDFLKQ